MNEKEKEALMAEVGRLCADALLDYSQWCAREAIQPETHMLKKFVYAFDRVRAGVSFDFLTREGAVQAMRQAMRELNGEPKPMAAPKPYYGDPHYNDIVPCASANDFDKASRQ